MSKRRRTSPALLALNALCMCVCACVPEESDGTVPGPDAASEAVTARLERMLAGRFDSSAQAAADARYFSVQLQTCSVDVPELGEHVLYVEQAIMTSLDAPYRQRLYVLTSEGPDRATSTIYEADDPVPLVGLCGLAEEERSARSPRLDALLPLVGCDVYLDVKEDEFVGSTAERTCLTDYNGASYVTSETTITEQEVRSWDRGYDDAGEQVWGAVAGAYVFVRQP